jgi:hypothetical protein
LKVEIAAHGAYAKEGAGEGHDLGEFSVASLGWPKRHSTISPQTCGGKHAGFDEK